MRIGLAGAGLLGRLMAYRLLKLGFSVTLFDPDFSGKNSAADVAAGMLAPFAEIDAEPLVFELGLLGTAAWQGIQGELGGDWLQQRGSIVVAHDSDHHELRLLLSKLERVDPAIKSRDDEGKSQDDERKSRDDEGKSQDDEGKSWNNEGKSRDDKSRHRLCDAAQLKALEPELDFAKSVFLPSEAAIEPRELFSKLWQALTASASFSAKEQAVTGVKPHTIVTEASEMTFDVAIDCRGKNAQENFADLRLIRGEVITIQAPEVNISRPVRLFHPRYNLYIVPRPNSIYVVGASEIETADSSPISVRSCLELLSACYSVHRGFAEARILEMNTGLRPTLADNLPRIINQKGLIAINGLYRHGFMLAPVLVDEAIHYITDSSYQCPYERIAVC